MVPEQYRLERRPPTPNAFQPGSANISVLIISIWVLLVSAPTSLSLRGTGAWLSGVFGWIVKIQCSRARGKRRAGLPEVSLRHAVRLSSAQLTHLLASPFKFSVSPVCYLCCWYFENSPSFLRVALPWASVPPPRLSVGWSPDRYAWTATVYYTLG